MFKTPKWVNGIFVGVFLFGSIYFLTKGPVLLGVADLLLLVGNVASLASKEN